MDWIKLGLRNSTDMMIVRFVCFVDMNDDGYDIRWLRWIPIQNLRGRLQHNIGSMALLATTSSLPRAKVFLLRFLFFDRSLHARRVRTRRRLDTEATRTISPITAVIFPVQDARKARQAIVLSFHPSSKRRRSDRR